MDVKSLKNDIRHRIHIKIFRNLYSGITINKVRFINGIVTTTETTKDLDQLVVRLERNHRCVLRQLQNINSYRYEPKDYECFVRLQDLRAGIKQLAEDQMLLFDRLQRKAFSLEEAIQKVNDLLARFKILESELASYLLDRGA